MRRATGRSLLCAFVLAGGWPWLYGADAVTSEREEFLFLLNPPSGPGFQGAVNALWVPAPMVKYCLGKSREECVAIDYCVRTTNRNVAECRNLSVDLNAIPKYSPSLYPRRVMGVTLFPAAADAIKGMDGLFAAYASRPRTELDRLSIKLRFKVRIRVKRSADDDDFDLLEVLSVPQF
jgi:hypothetical protein